MKVPPHLTELLRSSVIVTGTHYSTTTLVGTMLASAAEFHLLHEPLNPQPTPSFDSLTPNRWYEYYDETRYAELHGGLAGMLSRADFPSAIVRKVSAARSLRELGQIARYIQRRAPFLLQAKPAILKDPFLAFSARTLQQNLGTKVVVTIRHPGGFAESFIRKGGRFDFADLASQQPLMAALPGIAETIARFAREDQPPAAQAGLLWQTIYGFAERYILPDAKSALIRQEDLVSRTAETSERLFSFAGASHSRATERFLRQAMNAGTADHRGASYVQRDGRAAASKWRTRLSPKEIALVRLMTDGLAGRLGYSSADWPH